MMLSAPTACMGAHMGAHMGDMGWMGAHWTHSVSFLIRASGMAANLTAKVDGRWNKLFRNL